MAEWNVLDHGALGDGLTPDDDAVARVLGRAAAGDTVLFPAGHTFLLDGVRLRAAVTLSARGAAFRKAPRTPGHLFRDTAGTASGTRVLGGRFDMNRGAFTAGQTVSPFHFVRADDLVFDRLHVHDGVEEGLKLYACRRVRVVGCRFERIRNNGVQFHTPPVDGHTGTRPPRDSADLLVHACTFEDIDDGAEGRLDGHGVTFNATHTRHTTRDGVVFGCTFRRCIRGIWAEFGGGQGRRPGLRLRFVQNEVHDARFFGMGMVGVEDGAMIGNTVRATGARPPAPPDTSDETVGIVVSGDRWAETHRILCAENEVTDGRSPALMQYGIRLKRGSGHTVRQNRVSGALVRDVAVERDVTASDVQRGPAG
ncbi:MAG: hypothetical protein RJQ04_00250 [Longimicrobiales bacterium]